MGWLDFALVSDNLPEDEKGLWWNPEWNSLQLGVPEKGEVAGVVPALQLKASLFSDPV
jgi:hypothetical protein